MADTKISALAALGAAPATDDLIPLVDTSATATKSMTVANLFTSPSFTTPALGTPASGTVTNLTGTASININGTVGATTPTTATFTTATINTSIVPDANDGAVLGASGNGFSDLFLASGAVINSAAGTATLTMGSTIASNVDVTVPDEAYDATAWNGSLEVPTKNAVRDKIETLSTPTITTLTPTPMNGAITGGASETQYNATTRQYMYMFNVPASITVNKISIKTGGTTTTDVPWDITIYSADGQTKVIEITTATITTGDTVYSTAVSAVTLAPGNYYFAINTGGATGDCTFYSWTSATNAALGTSAGLSTDIASEPKLMGYATITAGTPSATFDPTAITEDTLTNVAVIFRLDN